LFETSVAGPARTIDIYSCICWWRNCHAN
jgi:hypothetical protein